MTAETRRVLYVDDNRLDRELVRDALQHGASKYELVEASSADEFEETLGTAVFDVVLTDFDICGFQGLEVLARVRERFPQVPVIVVTGTGSEEIAVDAMKGGASDYIIKSPRSIARLPASIEATLHSRRLAREKEAAERSLRESEARFRRAVVQAPVPVMIHADDGEILAISDVWFALTGYTPDELTSVNSWVDLAYRDRATQTLETIVRTYAGASPIDEGEFTVHCAGGSQRIWTFRSTPLGALPDGRRCAISIASDVTEHRALETQLRQSRKLEAVGRLAGGVAHDFNNMLQVILGYAALAIDEMGGKSAVPNWLSMIVEAADRSANLTRQLLAFARVQPLEPRRISIDEALNGIVKLLARIVEEQVELTCAVEPGTWDVEIDPAQLDSIVANLVINARDAIAGAGRIRVHAENSAVGPEQAPDVELAPGEYVAITVTDTGAGISRDDLDRVFEPFFTTKERGFGSGLGLATVYGIARQNGGSVSVVSEEGSGSTFSVLLPRHTRRAGKETWAWRRPPAASGDHRVLLVEDDDAVLAITERLLIDLGYRVTATGDPRHALDLARQGIGALDLIMTDVVMPGMDGVQLVDELRAVDPEVPVLFTSGYPAGTVNAHGVPSEDVHFLPKPFSREKLAEKVAEAIASRANGRESSNGGSP